MKAVHTPEAPAAIGPYSQAVAHGGLLYCSGQVALDPASGAFLDGTVTEQATRALANLDAVLRAGGSGRAHVISCTVYLLDMADFAAVNEAYAAFFGETRPARATVAVAGLPRGARVEIACIAAVVG